MNASECATASVPTWWVVGYIIFAVLLMIAMIGGAAWNTWKLYRPGGLLHRGDESEAQR